MAKKVCKLVKKDLQKEDPKEFRKVVKNAQFFCRNCGRVAKRSTHLCKPVKL